MTRSTVAEAKNMQGEEIVVSHVDEPDAVKVDILPDSDRREDAFGRDSSELPPGYFWSTRFIGSYCVSSNSPDISNGLTFQGHWSSICLWDGRVCVGRAHSRPD